MKRYICFHGINTWQSTYGLPLMRNVGGPPTDWVFVYWGDKVRADLLEWQKIAPQYRRRWWRPYTNWKRRMIEALYESLAWVRAYEDPDVQAAILAHTQRIIQQHRNQGVTQFVFVGHSLGSVVAVDAIQNAQQVGVLNAEDVHTLITMGSPLHHWKAPRKLAEIFANIQPRNRWINLYDKDDLIAGRISTFDERIEDREIQTGGIIGSHCNYWESKTVAQIVREEAAR